MEMPIRIMIVLFVTIAVGAAILVFSTQMIQKGKSDLENIGPDDRDVDDDKIIPLQFVDAAQIADLMTECHRSNIQERTLNRELCYVIIGKDASWTWPEIEDYFVRSPLPNANISIGMYVDDDDDAMSIYYNPEGIYDTIEITKT